MRIKNCFSVLCAVLILWAGGFLTVSCNRGNADLAEALIPAPEPAGVADDADRDSFLIASPKPAPLFLNLEERPDIILLSYLDPALRERVVAFFRDLTGSHKIAAVVLSNAVMFDIPPALAFALCWEESSYKPQAINLNRNDTIDRGLFQLNSASFPNLEVEDFYDPEVNSRLGLAHLRWCLNTAGTEVAGLAMYNAGIYRVRSVGTPKNTLDYVSRILKNQRRIEELFKAEYSRIAWTETEEPEKKEKFSLRLSLLTPLGGR